jgi:hypothetical protein
MINTTVCVSSFRLSASHRDGSRFAAMTSTRTPSHVRLSRTWVFRCKDLALDTQMYRRNVLIEGYLRQRDCLLWRRRPESSDTVFKFSSETWARSYDSQRRRPTPSEGRADPSKLHHWRSDKELNLVQVLPHHGVSCDGQTGTQAWTNCLV